MYLPYFCQDLETKKKVVGTCLVTSKTRPNGLLQDQLEDAGQLGVPHAESLACLHQGERGMHMQINRDSYA